MQNKISKRRLLKNIRKNCQMKKEIDRLNKNKRKILGDKNLYYKWLNNKNRKKNINWKNNWNNLLER